MDVSKDLKKLLAEEIRAAIAETSPAPGGPHAAESPTAPARASMRRAAETLTPSVPPGAPLEPVKRLAIRALRFLWRNQAAFNSLSLDAASELADGLDRLRAESERRWDELSRRAGVQEARLTLAESAGSASGAAPGRPAAPAAEGLPAGVYALFEERYRGSPGQIEQGQRRYLDLLRGVAGPVLDVGCGRGEFLRLLKGAGIAAAGIESNPISAASCRKEGLEVEEADALATLAKRPAGRLGAIVAFQVVEHWAPAILFQFLQQARRALAPGGLLLAETINADSISALRAFYLDPTHVRPVPPEALRFLSEAAGFTDIRIEYRSPLPASERLEERSDNERKLNALLFGPQDYALIGRAPAAVP